MKKFFGLLALIVALNFSVAVAAQIQSVTDKAGVLKPTEVELLNQRIRNIEQTHKIKIGVAFVKSVGGRDMPSASRELLEKNFGNSVNGSIVLLVAMDKRKYEIDTNPKMRERITDHDGVHFLKEKFQSDLSAGKYYGATNNFVDGVDELLTYYETNGAPYGAAIKPKGFDPAAAGGAVVIALFIGVVIRSSLIGSMSNIRHAMAAIDYLKKNTVKLTENRDTFLFMHVKRRPRGGGGNRGGGSHGGGHGGGGGSF